MAEHSTVSKIARPSPGSVAQQLRLWSGLVLFSFALLHFLNHALGIISIEWMDAFQSVRRGFWRSLPGTVLLCVAAVVHTGLGIWKIAQRRTVKMPPWEAFQIGLVILIPYQLAAHVVVTRGLNGRFGIDDTYAHELTLLWPGEAWAQSILLLAVWAHGMLGIHFWLRIRHWYQRAIPAVLITSVIVPGLSLWGWIEAGRRLRLEGGFDVDIPEAAYYWALDTIDVGRWVTVGLIAFAFAIPALRYSIQRFRSHNIITYPGRGDVRARKGATLLEISREAGIPHASVCGGRARCSTCRTLIVENASDLPPPSDAEMKVLQRISADPRVRLACQLRPDRDLVVQPLMPARGAESATGNSQDAYHWGVEKPAVIMFADMRDFTTIAEDRLPYDVVFLLNRYLGLMSDAIQQAGGRVDKFIGDGIMAIFGISDSLQIGSRQALAASIGMANALDALNDEIGLTGDDRLRIGIGIHAGPVILGRIGAAGASNNITALGDTVNAASRLESANKEHGSMLIVSEQVLRAAKAEVQQAKRDSISVKGKRQSLDVVIFKDPRVLGPALAESVDA